MTEHHYMFNQRDPLDMRCRCGATREGVLDHIYPRECISAEHTKEFYDRVMSEVTERLKRREEEYAMSEQKSFFRGPEIKFQTENVAAFPEEAGAGRDPTNVGKTRIHLELLFDNVDEAVSWMESQGIPTEAIRP